MGPSGGYLTTIEFAALLGREVDGFVPPPDFVQTWLTPPSSHPENQENQRVVQFVDELPLTPTGKILKRELA